MKSVEAHPSRTSHHDIRVGHERHFEKYQIKEGTVEDRLAGTIPGL